PCEHVYDRRREQVEEWSNGYTCRRQTMNNTTILRGGATPFNVLSISTAHGSPGSVDHPAVLPFAVADWWVRYLCRPVACCSTRSRAPARRWKPAWLMAPPV